MQSRSQTITIKIPPLSYPSFPSLLSFSELQKTCQMRLFLLIPSLTKNQSPTNNQPLAMEKKKKVRELQGHLLTVKVVVVVVVGMFLKCLTVKDCLLLWLLKFKGFLELLTCWNGKPLVLLIFIGRSSLKNGQSLIRKKRSQKSNTKATTDLGITVPETANNAIAIIEYLDAMRSSINCKLGQAIREIVGFTRDVGNRPILSSFHQAINLSENPFEMPTSREG